MIFAPDITGAVENVFAPEMVCVPVKFTAVPAIDATGIAPELKTGFVENVFDPVIVCALDKFTAVPEIDATAMPPALKTGFVEKVYTAVIVAFTLSDTTLPRLAFIADNGILANVILAPDITGGLLNVLIPEIVCAVVKFTNDVFVIRVLGKFPDATAFNIAICAGVIVKLFAEKFPKIVNVVLAGRFNPPTQIVGCAAVPKNTELLAVICAPTPIAVEFTKAPPPPVIPEPYPIQVFNPPVITPLPAKYPINVEPPAVVKSCPQYEPIAVVELPVDGIQQK